MRSDHLSKHIKTHGKPDASAEMNQTVIAKDMQVGAEADDSNSLSMDQDNCMHMAFESEDEDESGSEISDSEIASTGPSQPQAHVTESVQA